jgi:hypothetical protein
VFGSVRVRDATAFFVLFAAATGAVPQPVHAYIDPLSGSIILQVLAAAFLAAAYTMKRFWGRIRQVFRDAVLRLGGRHR